MPLTKYRIWAMLALFAAVVVLAGGALFAFASRQLTDYQWRVLEAQAEERVREVHGWLQERERDAHVVLHHPLYRAALLAHLSRGEELEPGWQALHSALELLLEPGLYENIVLLDAQGGVRFSVGARAEDPVQVREAAAAAAAQRRAVFRDLAVRADGGTDVRVLMAAPLLDNGRYIGALTFRLQPYLYASPLVEEWPAFASSAEVLVFRAEPERIVYLTQPRFRDIEAVERFPSLVSAQVAMGKGRVRGVDYRNVASIGMGRRIADTPWFLIAKIDQREVDGVLRQLALGTLILMLLLLAGGGWIGRAVWRRQQAELRAARYKADIERQALARHFDYLAKYANDIIVLIDEHERIVEVNDRAVEAYGYSREELRGMPVQALRARGEASFAEQRALVNSSQGLVYETVHRRKDGSTFPVEASVRPVDVGAHRHYQGILRDISERKRAEAAVRKSEERLKEAQRIAQVGSWELDLVRDVLTWSDEIYRIFEVDPARFGASYQAFLAIVHPDDRAAVDAAYTNSVKTRTPYSIEHRLLFPDGRIKYVLEQSETVYDDGKPLRSVGTVQDITERKRTEEALHRLNVELEHALSELRASQEQVIQSEKLAALGTLAAGVAHELNNPLMGVLNFVDYLRRAVEDPELQEVLGDADRELKRMRDLLKNMLAFARPVSEALSDVQMGEVLQRVTGLMEAEFRARQIAFVKDWPPTLPFVAAKPGALQQVFLNLLLNARDAVETSAEKTVQLRAYETPAAVCVEVRDSGVGIPEEIQGRIFDPFFTTKPPGKGSGLGLSISQSIIRDLGGTLQVQSRPGEGATFTVALPKRPAAAAA